MSTKSVATFGPFVGGLNNAANTPDTIADNELFVCQDFDYNIDYTLVTRPPVAIEARTAIANVDDHFANILGFFTDPATGDVYCIACFGNNLYYRKNSTSYTDAGTWTLINAGFGVATCGVQYVDSFYIGKATAGGAKWSIAGGYAAVAPIPGITSMAVFKERIWSSSAISTTSARLVFSDLGTGDTWNVANFIDIGAGDGQKLVKVFAGPSMLYLFKKNSTYVFTYDSKPSLGYVQNISTTVGIFDPKCVTEYQGIIFVMDGNKVFKLTGTFFTRVNTKVVIDRDTTSGTYPQAYSLSTVGDRIAVQYSDNLYMYYPITDTWTQWKIGAVSKWWYVPNSLEKYGYKVYLTGVNATAPSTGNVLEIQDGRTWDNTMPADIAVTDPIIVTKMYSFSTPEDFKRLHWWGVDAIVYQQSSQDAYVRLVALPYTFSSYETYTLMSSSLTWAAVGTGTWLDLASEVGAISSRWHVTSADRKYLKADKSLRFTRMQFKVQLDAYDHSAISSVNHIILEMSVKQSPVSQSEGTRS